MKIDILTLFPEMFEGPFNQSIIKRAKEKGLVEINIYNLRNWAEDKHKTTDDRSFGGGAGMILKVDVIDRAVSELRKKYPENTKVILLDASGKIFTQKEAKVLSKTKHLILIAGHYEGVDYRVHKYIADKVYSIGDYVLTGGEIPAMVVVDAVVRLLPNVLKKKEALESESFNIKGGEGILLEYPQYTRPENYKGWKVPRILLSGNHQKIRDWRLRESIKRTKKIRPDLLKHKG